MKIAILSDIHDNIWNLDRALEQVQDADRLICCGDLCAPFVVDRLAKGFSKPIHIVFGNNDGDLFRITQKARQYGHVTLHGEFADLAWDGKRIAVNHFPEIAIPLAASGAYDVVCCGHSHQYEVIREGRTLRINPGEVMGGLSGEATFVIFDSLTNEVTRYQIQPANAVRSSPRTSSSESVELGKRLQTD